MSVCLTCFGTGIIITCCDDLCANSDHCIHGDGEEMCPDCEGEGEINDDFDDGWCIPPDERLDYPDEFNEPSVDEEARIADEEYEYNHGICSTCGGEFGEGWSTCTCNDEEEPCQS